MKLSVILVRRETRTIDNNNDNNNNNHNHNDNNSDINSDNDNDNDDNDNDDIKLAYGGCTRSSSGSQDLLSYRNDTIMTRQLPFSSQQTKIKTLRKLLWPLPIVKLRIPGLIDKKYHISFKQKPIT